VTCATCLLEGLPDSSRPVYLDFIDISQRAGGGRMRRGMLQGDNYRSDGWSSTKSTYPVGIAHVVRPASSGNTTVLVRPMPGVCISRSAHACWMGGGLIVLTTRV